MPVIILLILLSLFIGLASRHIPKYLVSNAEQELCEFGTGSTELYDSLRAEAEAYLAENGEVRFAGYSSLAARDFSVAIFGQLRDFAMTRPTPTERWAAIHALLRAYGMEFDFNGPRDPESLKSDLVHLGATYIALLPTLNWICPLCYVFPEAALRIKVTNRGDGTYDQIRGVFVIRSLNPTVGAVYDSRRRQTCPQILK